METTLIIIAALAIGLAGARALGVWGEEDPLTSALRQGQAAIQLGEHRWFGGEWAGYRFVLTYMTTSPHLMGESRRPTLKVVLACKTKTKLRASAFRRVDTQVPLSGNFEESFDGEDLDRVAEPTRDALTQFADQFGSVWIRDREEASSALVPTGVLQNSTVLIGWLVPFEEDRKRVRKALAGLVAIAATLENSSTP